MPVGGRKEGLSLFRRVWSYVMRRSCPGKKPEKCFKNKGNSSCKGLGVRKSHVGLHVEGAQQQFSFTGHSQCDRCCSTYSLAASDSVLPTALREERTFSHRCTEGEAESREVGG
jgi:hypothetical protein